MRRCFGVRKRRQPDNCNDCKRDLSEFHWLLRLYRLPKLNHDGLILSLGRKPFIPL